MLHKYKCVNIAIQHKYTVAKYDNVCASQRLCFASILRCFAADRFAATTVDLTLHAMSVIYTLYIYIYKHETVLSTHIWECKSRSSTWKVNWKILDRGQPFNPVTKTCKLCVRERFYIIRKPHLASLNYRQEIGTFCPHIRMSLLRNIEKVKVPD